jgi:predicted lipid-binding transport protein (Tim44 family)
MLTRLLTILPLLLCPLLMLACMWAMRNREPPQRQDDAAQQEQPTAARVAQLEREVAELRARLPEADAAGEPASAAALDPSRRSRNGTPVPPG